jgi:trehalose synthase-fused probable maltokinase
MMPTTDDGRGTTGDDALAVQALDLVRVDDWFRFFDKQRWFGERGITPSDVRLVCVVPLPWGNGAFAMTQLGMTVGGREFIYQVPAAARPVRAEVVPERALIASVDLHGTSLTVFDAVDDPEFQRGLADALASECEAIAPTGERWITVPVSEQRVVVPEQTEIRVGSAEQTNTSIIFGLQAIFKLFRKLEAGVHPDVEVNEFLTIRARFAHTPAVLATARFERAGSRMVSGALQEFLPDSRDAWSYAIDRAAPFFTAAPGDKRPTNEFLPDARRLGEVTRELHQALASDHTDPAFSPVPAAPDDLDRWAQRTQQMIRDSMALLERRLPEIKGDRAAEARVLVQRRDRYLAWVNEIVDELGDDLGARTRTHGDYHLGQVLRTASHDFVIIDFEGEPTRPLEERREKTSPLRDVAGMLRSFGYAAATLARSVEKTTDMSTRELRAGRWERDVRGAFLAGYLKGEEARTGGRDDGRGILPRDESHAKTLIALFETEKAFYELAYELNHRLDWVGIPMRGISKLLVR